MEDALAIATDDSVEEGEDEDEEEESKGPKATRMQALANLEMLVQDIDNAKHLANKDMRMWKQLQDLLTSPKSSPNITKQALWAIGTALQNSPEAQDAYLGLKPIPTILSFLDAKHTSKTRAKAVYALSGLLKHNKSAVDSLGAAGGWQVLRTTLEDSPISIRRKISFLINFLLLPSTNPIAKPLLTIQDGPALRTPVSLDTPTPPSLPSPPQTPKSSPIVHPNSHASIVSDPSSANTSPMALKAMREYTVLESVISVLSKFEVDSQVQENCVKILHTFAVICSAPFSSAEKTRLRKFLDAQSREVGGDNALAESWDLRVEELKALKMKVAED